MDAHGGHRGRLRQRVEAEGLDSLEPHELIEFLLYYAIPRQDVNALAHALAERFGGVEGVLRADAAELAAVPGIGARTARWLMLAGEAAIACAHLKPEDKPPMGCFQDVLRYALKLRRTLRPPCALQLLGDIDGRLIFCRELCPSLSWAEPETLREALGDVLRLSARSAVILLFVGARGAEAGVYDLRHAREYAHALHAAGSALMDVVIVGDAEVSSLRKQNLVPDLGGDELMRMLRENYLRPREEAPEAED